MQQLSGYQFRIFHRPGIRHANADAVSIITPEQNVCKQCKRSLTEESNYTPFESHVNSLRNNDTDNEGDNACETLVCAVDGDKNVTGMSSDKRCNKLLDFDVCIIDPENQVELNADHKKKKKRGRKSNIPPPAKPKSVPDIEISPDVINRHQLEDKVIGEIFRKKLESADRPTIDSMSDKSPELKFWLARWNLLEVQNNMLCEYWEYSPKKATWRICTPDSLKDYVLYHLHDSRTSGHLGISKTWKKAQMCPYYWQGMRKSVEDYVKSCDLCEERKDPKHRKRNYMKSYIVGGAFERIATDLAGPFPVTRNGNSYILVIADYFTKLTEVFPIPDMEAETVADALVRGWIKRYGCPLEIHSDQGRQYESSLFSSVCKLLEIHKTRTTPFHPRSDGMVERANRTFKDMLSKYIQQDQTDWDEHIDFLTMAYNNTPHESTDVSLHRMVYGSEMRVPLDIILGSHGEGLDVHNEHHYAVQLGKVLRQVHDFARETLGKASERQKRHYDRNVRNITFSEGDYVRRKQIKLTPGAKAKLKRNWTGPWVIIQKLDDVLYKIQQSAKSNAVIVHADNIKPYTGNATFDWYTPRNHERLIAELPNNLTLRGDVDGECESTPTQPDGEFGEKGNMDDETGDEGEDLSAEFSETKDVNSKLCEKSPNSGVTSDRMSPKSALAGSPYETENPVVTRRGRIIRRPLKFSP